MGKWTAQEPRPPELRKQACLPAWEGRSCENLTHGRDQNLTGGWQMYLGGIQPRPSALPPSALQKLHEDHAAPWLLAVSPERDRANCTGTAGAGLSWDVGAAGEPPPRREGARCPWVGFGVLRAAARSSSKTWVALDSIRGAGPRRATSAYEPCARNDQRFLASRTPVYGKRGPKWCIASPGGPRRVQTYPGFGSTTRMPFSPDTGKPRTARRGWLVGHPRVGPLGGSQGAQQEGPPGAKHCLRRHHRQALGHCREDGGRGRVRIMPPRVRQPPALRQRSGVDRSTLPTRPILTLSVIQALALTGKKKYTADEIREQTNRSHAFAFTTHKKCLGVPRAFLCGVSFPSVVRHGLKVLLLLDNRSAHPVNPLLSAVEILFLPPNTTAKLQPMDQGVIANLKVHYQNHL
ncbi:hypothetical protein HPB47_007334 [Ixodes persulcatus]|uniref:Uncharacterized protein n=1 Tax=Ixodes persulcatus TaxID=34615 RepID=A0AC60P7L8_IXOPE|nr:hypothetical protein HPB47_007334 [Ixodes persulcatus]